MGSFYILNFFYSLEMENIIYEVGNNIKTIRKSKGLTQAQLAEKINVDSKYISRLETGSSIASLSTILKLANVLDVETKVLFTFENKKKNIILKRINKELLKINSKELDALYQIIKALADKNS